MKIGIVILNYNNYEETKKCVNSILKQKGVLTDIVIIDNGSANNSYLELYSLFNQYKNIHIILSKENLGYAKGNNLGIEYLRKKGINYIFIANSDVYFSSDYILRQIMDDYECGVGLMVPIIQNLDGTIDQRVVYKKKFLYLRIIKKILQINCRTSKTKNRNKRDIIIEENKKIIGLQKDCFVVSGSGFLLTPDFFEHYSGLFSKTFLYFEEWATIIMLYKAKLLTKVVKSDIIIHKGAASSYNGKDASSIKLKYMRESSKKILGLIFTSKKYIN